MYEIEYILGGVRVAGFMHSGSQASVRRIAEDGVRRHCADHARIIDLITEHSETWPRPN
jgi:hypothetical protein